MKYSDASVWENNMKLIIRRGLAELIDLTCCWIVSLFLQMVLPFNLGNAVMGGWMQSAGWMFIVAVAYETFCDAVFAQTFGKRLMFLEVRTANNLDLSLTRSLVRSLIKNVCIFFLYSILAAFSMLYMATQNLHSSFHDRITETEVWTKKRHM